MSVICSDCVYGDKPRAHSRSDKKVEKCIKCGKWATRFRGLSGKVWVNSSKECLYQLIPSLHEGCGMCIQSSSFIGPWWPIPHCRGCNCHHFAIKPGEVSKPFVALKAILDELTPDGQDMVMGRLNWIVFRAGLVKWRDVVTTNRVREFHEVMDRAGLTVEQMVAAGVPAADAQGEWDVVHTPERAAVDEQRRQSMARLKELGLSSEEIKARVGKAIASRFKSK